MRLGTGLLMITLLATGCVGKKKYTALEGELSAARQEARDKLKERGERIESLEQALSREKALAAELEEKVAALEERNALLIKDKSKLDSSIQEMADALRDLESRKAASDARVKEFQDLMSRLADLIDAGRLEVKIVDGRMVVGLASDILFASGSADLSEDGTSYLKEIGGVLESIPDRQFQVEGHTDNVPINNRVFKSNWELGAARAVNVVQALSEGGVALHRLSAASYSDHRPVEPNETAEGRAANRRIEIVVVPDLSLLPGSSELEEMASVE